MHTDMQGSAVAVGTLLALERAAKRRIDIDCWLAITENEIGARAFRPQEVVRAANGVTIQVAHSDAEGRMVLADTLALAARERPELIVDFATLTGACVNALTERYSGAFTNRPQLARSHPRGGPRSGERVWPFPMDEDYDSDLEIQDRRCRCNARRRWQGRSHSRRALPEPLRAREECPGSTSIWRPATATAASATCRRISPASACDTRWSCCSGSGGWLERMTRLALLRPDDWHLHVRDGAARQRPAVHRAAVRARDHHAEPEAAGDDGAMAAAYRERILAALPPGSRFEPLMTLYLTDTTEPQGIARKGSGFILGASSIPPAPPRIRMPASRTSRRSMPCWKR